MNCNSPILPPHLHINRPSRTVHSDDVPVIPAFGNIFVNSADILEQKNERISNVVSHKLRLDRTYTFQTKLTTPRTIRSRCEGFIIISHFRRFVELLCCKSGTKRKSALQATAIM